MKDFSKQELQTHAGQMHAFGLRDDTVMNCPFDVFFGPTIPSHVPAQRTLHDGLLHDLPICDFSDAIRTFVLFPDQCLRDVVRSM
eukprot:scaffold37_cov346-Pavlova_lutheri.AAC.5